MNRQSGMEEEKREEGKRKEREEEEEEEKNDDCRSWRWAFAGRSTRDCVFV